MTPGEIINDRYILVRSIGRGSFGEVWLATDQKLGLDVAIKIYIALDTRGLNEFKNEFKNVYNLHHPNLLRADYFDNVGNNPYLVMPFCPTSVGDNVGKMEEDDIWAFIKDVAAGLAYLHSNDIIHRDIKPDNILKDEQGNYVITDFGLSTKMRSTLRKASARQNDSSNQSGTIGYMAPEMFSAKPNAVKATDIWALGATIYEIATGEMPFCGQGGIMELHGAELPELPSKFSKELSELMTKCLAKDAWDRPTAQEIVEGLKTASSNNNDAVSRETYDYEINSLKNILERERENHRKTIDSLQSTNTNVIPKKFKIWCWISSIAVIVLGIVCISLNNSCNYWCSEYFAENEKNSTLSSEVALYREANSKKESALETLMKNTPILASNIQVWNNGENKNAQIYAKNSTFIYHSADFISNKDFSNEKILVKFIAPYGVSTGTIDGKPSPSGYSYSQTVNLMPYTSQSYESSGWGGSTKGNWSSGNYRIEYWHNGKCIGSKSFTIK